ncbi:MAG: flagellar biosynthetic protein FliR [Rhodospirillales bacterium]
MLQEFLSLNIFNFFLVFSRVGTAVSLFPGFSSVYVNIRARLVIGLGVSLAVMPFVAASLPEMPAAPSDLGILIAGEVLIGAFFGVITRAFMASLQTAGTLIAYFSSMANALIQDPIVEQQSSLFGGFLTTVGIVIIFVTDTHHLMIRAVAESYGLFVPGQPLVTGDFSEIVARRVADGFKLGVQMSSPVIVTAITYYLGLGLLTRLMPALPVFFFGLPIQVSMQISVFMITFSSMMLVFMSRFEEGLTSFLTP